MQMVSQKYVFDSVKYVAGNGDFRTELILVFHCKTTLKRGQFRNAWYSVEHLSLIDGDDMFLIQLDPDSLQSAKLDSSSWKVGAETTRV